MRFEKCLTCPAIKGQQCAGPNFMTVSTKEIIEWGNAYQKLNGITNAQLAERSGVPKGTIDGMKYRTDVRHDTLYPLMKALIELTGGEWGGDSCPIAVGGLLEHQQEATRLTQELERTKKLLERCTSVMKWLTIAIIALFALCAGMIALLLLLHL